MLIAGVVGEGHYEAIVGQQLGGDLSTSVHHDGIDEVFVLHSIKQRVSERGLSALAAEGAVGVQQQPPLSLAGVAHFGAGLVKAPQVVSWSGSKSELVTDKIVEHRTGVATNGAMGFIRDHKIEVGRREEGLVLVVKHQGLNGGDHDLR